MSGPIGTIVSTNAMPGTLLRRRAQSLEQNERRSHAAGGRQLSAHFSLGLSYLLRKQAVKENGLFYADMRWCDWRRAIALAAPGKSVHGTAYAKVWERERSAASGARSLATSAGRVRIGESNDYDDCADGECEQRDSRCE